MAKLRLVMPPVANDYGKDGLLVSMCTDFVPMAAYCGLFYLGNPLASRLRGKGSNFRCEAMHATTTSPTKNPTADPGKDFC